MIMDNFSYILFLLLLSFLFLTCFLATWQGFFLDRQSEGISVPRDSG